MNTSKEQFESMVLAIQSAVASELDDGAEPQLETENRLELVWWHLRRILGLPDDYWDNNL